MDGNLAETLRSRVVRQATELVGAQGLADRVKVSRAMVHSWLSGTATPPPRAFRTMLYLLRKAHPAYQPDALFPYTGDHR